MIVNLLYMMLFISFHSLFESQDKMLRNSVVTFHRAKQKYASYMEIWSVVNARYLVVQHIIERLWIKIYHHDLTI